MNDGEALYRNICANPEDDTPRLVYADYLDENGQHEYAQFIRWSIELERVDSVSSFSGIADYKEKEKWCKKYEIENSAKLTEHIRDITKTFDDGTILQTSRATTQKRGFIDTVLLLMEDITSEQVITIPERKIERYQLSEFIVRLMKETPVRIFDLWFVNPQRITSNYPGGKLKRVFRWNNANNQMPGRLPRWLFDRITVTKDQWKDYRMNQENVAYQVSNYDTAREAKDAMGYALCSYIRELVYET